MMLLHFSGVLCNKHAWNSERRERHLILRFATPACPGRMVMRDEKCDLIHMCKGLFIQVQVQCCAEAVNVPHTE